jgi:hypothetical protein
MVRSDLVRFSLPYNQSVLEWIAYHKLQGFEHFYIYADENPAPLRRLLAPYIADGLVDVIDWEWPTPGFKHQEAQINSCVHRYRGLAKWVGFFDIDEFFQPLSKKDTVRTIVGRADPRVGSLRVASLWFFHCSNCTLSNHTLQTQKFMYRSPYASVSYIRAKLIVRPENVQTQSVHDVTVGNPVKFLDPMNGLRLNHYKNRVTGHVHDPSMAKFAKPIAVEVARVLRLVGGQ